MHILHNTIWTKACISPPQLQKRVETWPRESVLRWLTYLGMEKYADHFKAITGQVGLPL